VDLTLLIRVFRSFNDAIYRTPLDVKKRRRSILLI
jgi:hypothetical protein